MAVREQLIPRETAEAAPQREVAEDRTFTEAEHLAILADRVATETASRDAEIAALKDKLTAADTEKAELQSKLDVEAARAEKAEQDFTAYKAEEAAKAEVAQRLTQRADKVREVATHVKDEFFTDERKQRWAEMAEADFDNFVAELAAVAGTPATTAETAAAKTSMGGDTPKAVEGSKFFEMTRGGAA